MNACLGYNKLNLAEAGTCYTIFLSYSDIDHTIIHFGHINDDVNYQKVVNKLLAEKFGTNMEPYADEMLV